MLTARIYTVSFALRILCVIDKNTRKTKKQVCYSCQQSVISRSILLRYVMCDAASCGCSGAWRDISRARHVVSSAPRNVSHVRRDGSRALHDFSSVLRDISCVQHDVSRVLRNVTCALCSVSHVLCDFSWVPECRWVEHYRTKKMQD